MQTSLDYDSDHIPVLFCTRNPSKNWNDIDHSHYIENEDIFKEMNRREFCRSYAGIDQANEVAEKIQIAKINNKGLEWEVPDEHEIFNENMWSKVEFKKKTSSEFISKYRIISELKKEEGSKTHKTLENTMEQSESLTDGQNNSKSEVMSEDKEANRKKITGKKDTPISNISSHHFILNFVW